VALTLALFPLGRGWLLWRVGKAFLGQDGDLQSDASRDALEVFSI